MFVSKLRRALAPATFVIVALTAAPSFADEVQLPQTAAEHEARAMKYQEEAAEYRKDAAEHKQMAAEYAAARPDIKGVGTRPDVMKMSKHCEALAKDYAKLATDAEKAADYHMMRAKEMQGG